MRCLPRRVAGNHLSVLFLFLGIVFVSPALAQLETATVSGQVVDPSGLSLAGAHIKLVDIDRDTTTTVATNNSGLYTFASVHPGRYRMEVDAAGFRKVNVTGLTLNVQDHIEQNFRLQIGSVAESVTVEANAQQVNTTDATVCTVVDRQFAENLPLNGRSFQTLIELTPGVVLTPSNQFDSGQFSVNGQRAASNYWTVDGVSANIGISASATGGNGMGGTLGSFIAQGGTNSLVSVDALQEFRIQTSTYAPEFGRTPGGQISIVTRSGANQVHGSVFDYLRNDALDASDWFDGYIDVPPLRKGEERQNDFGGTISGPILKDRTFYFFSYEGLRLRLPQTLLTTVPCDSSCAVAGDVRTLAVPAMQPYFNAFPLPNGPEVLCNPVSDPTCPSPGSTGSAEFNKSFSNPSTLDAYSLRIDHKLKDNISLFGRYNSSPSEVVTRASSGQALSVLSPSQINIQTATFGTTWTISPTIVDDLRFNYSRTNSFSSDTLDNFGGAVPLTALPFPAPFTNENALLTFAIFSLNSSGDTLRTGDSLRNLQRQVNLVDNIAVQTGSHMLKFGLDFRRLSPLAAPAQYIQGAYFTDVPSSETGNTYYGSTSSNVDATLRFLNFSFFAQDTWHSSPRLTIVYGFRWDLDFAPSSLQGPSVPSVTGYNLNDFSQLAVGPTGTPPFKTTYGNIAPRLGLAYRLDQDQKWGSVLRGGLGVFYDLISSETGNLVGSGYSPFGVFNQFTGTFPFTPAQAAAPVIPAPNISNVYAFNPNLKLPYTLEWNIALEQALGRSQSLSASYIGAAGRRLMQTTFVISPPTNPSVFGLFVDNTAVSSYNALQVQFQRRLSHGLQILSSYAWSHSIDTGSAGSAELYSNAGLPGIGSNINRGPSDFDIRHAFSAALTYDVPVPKIGIVEKALLSRWSIQSLIQARSATPVDLSDSHFSQFDNGAIGDVRPDLVPGQPLYLYRAQCAAVLVQPLVASGQAVPPCPGGRGFNPAAFTDPPFNPATFFPLRQGDVPRNFLRGFGATQVDLSVHRDFPVHESLKLQFRAEMFNVLNHPNFGPPNGSFVSPAFGGPTAGFGLSPGTLNNTLNAGNSGGGAFSALYQIGGPRSIQVALKLVF